MEALKGFLSVIETFSEAVKDGLNIPVETWIISIILILLLLIMSFFLISLILTKGIKFISKLILSIAILTLDILMLWFWIPVSFATKKPICFTILMR